MTFDQSVHYVKEALQTPYERGYIADGEAILTEIQAGEIFSSIQWKWNGMRESTTRGGAIKKTN